MDASSPDTLPDLNQRYLQWVDQVVERTLKGQIRSKEQVGQLLSTDIATGTGEIFERCLGDRLAAIQTAIAALPPSEEFKLAKANRRLKALQTIEAAWNQLQTQTQRDQAVGATLTALQSSPDALQVLSQSLDPNRRDALTLEQLGQLGKTLTRPDIGAELRPQFLSAQDLAELAQGIQGGIAAWQQLESQVVGWVYDDQRSIGFGEEQRTSPWDYWARQIPKTWVSQLLQALNQGNTVSWLAEQRQLQMADWVTAVIVLSFLQRAIVSWFEHQVYNAKISHKFLVSIYLSFAALWGQLSHCWARCAALPAPQQQQLSQHCLQLCFQVLQTFSGQAYFPLYGGIFATLGGQSLRRILLDIEQPLRQLPPSQPKARMLTLLAYALQVQGDYAQAETLFQQALEIAETIPDPFCTTATLNHLSRLWLKRKDYATAMSYGQRALVLSRQQGNPLGEANALASLGFAESFASSLSDQLTDHPEAQESRQEASERAIYQLQRGLALGEQLQDPQIQALCGCSLGMIYLKLNQPTEALEPLQNGWKAARQSGDIYLVGLNVAYLAQAMDQTWRQTPASSPESAANTHSEPGMPPDKMYSSIIFSGCLGMCLLYQIGAQEWQQAAASLVWIEAEIGAAAFEAILSQNRSDLIPEIGVDGYDDIPRVLQQYRDLQ
jgi:tetratricopeptide (TPR) repeat protein